VFEFGTIIYDFPNIEKSGRDADIFKQEEWLKKMSTNDRLSPLRHFSFGVAVISSWCKD